MAHSIKKLYVVHHSHTDIGYTDLQERVIDTQTDYIRSALQIMQKPENADFRWNCETLFCVEEFFKQATEAERAEFSALAAAGKLGLSANYLNFNDLVDCGVFRERLREWQKIIPMRTAMTADINGISMGYRDAMLAEGVEFLFMNIHCHHGMYPLYQNQNAFWWENAAGQRLLVWNGEHYHLGNALGLVQPPVVYFMTENYFGPEKPAGDPVDSFHHYLEQYLNQVEEAGYGYDFLVTGVSGVFSDNGPPEPKILDMIRAHGERYGNDVEICMVSLQELYEQIAPKLQNAPVYRGDLTDWWANGVGSTPYAVKHYLDARHRWQLCERLDGGIREKYPELCRTIQDNLLLYAEHTWGHSATITDPYETMVLDLDIRKQSYASKAHEAASRMLGSISREKGDILRYYSTEGTIKVCNPTALAGALPVEFYIESPYRAPMEVRDADGNIITCQVSPHPRGRRVTYVDRFEAQGERRYTYRELPHVAQTLNTRRCYVGSERIRDIVSDYDPDSYRLPYEVETPFFKLSYRVGEGITALIDKKNGKNLSGRCAAPVFTPMYEVTAIDGGAPEFSGSVYEQRRGLGRNIRGQHAKLFVGKLESVSCLERGPVFTLLRLRYSLPGTVRADVLWKLYAHLPRIDVTLQLGKTISSDIESIFLPLVPAGEGERMYLRKGAEAFRPGVDQIPGSCMEYYMSDEGTATLSENGGILIANRDVPLVYMGEMAHHPIRLCDGRPENNRRPVYAWVMNNTWETNFKMDLSGFCEYRFTIWHTEEPEGEKAMDELREHTFDTVALVTG